MINFALSKEQQMVRKEVAKLVKGVVTDTAHDMDEERRIPEEAIQKAWELGFSISMIPESYGGFGLKDSPVETALIFEELACGDMAYALAVMMPSLFIHPLADMGTKAQKEKYLPLYCGDTYKACTLAIQEPHVGFDPVDLKTTAGRREDTYVLNGRKCFVPGAAAAGHMLVAASLAGENSLFIVPGDAAGMTIGEKEKNLGLYALDTFEVAFDHCEIPLENRLGGEEGCHYNRLVQKSRVAMAAIGTGVARASLAFAKDYARQRVQFGEPIVHKQSVAFMLAEMAYEVDAMRLMTWKAASRLEAGKDAARESYLAKLYTGEMAMKVTDHGVQVMGGHGYIRDYPVERYYRNGRGIGILEGMAIL